MVAPVPPPEIIGQINGFWLDESHQPFVTPPNFLPTGAILPPLGLTDLSEFTCLDIVPVQVGQHIVWLPLSEAAVYTYAHSFGMFYGERWRFLCWGSDALPREYDAAYTTMIPREAIGPLYGPVAEMRARQDYYAMQLHLRIRT